ncbi:hypothetical protein NG755_05570 [Aliarcobacter cryaerophilus]|uniref:hypothetical protein n=1 Tax=Aliarcobacter cryaerophilus TaxID=28198 RepID=UPI003DA2736D
MTSPIQLNKTYGVLHTESFFSFLGFTKKVGSDEIQKIDVFLDDKLIDTIEANEFIQKIDDMYDVESKAFTYNLPTQYIGKKAIISFKNHDSGEELLNSPYTLIDKNQEKFNEAKFLHSLSEPIDEEKIKDMYCPNAIGFLATEENLADEEFVGYIKELMVRFPDVEFKGFCFSDRQKESIELIFKNEIDRLKLLLPKNIYDIAYEVEIFIENWISTSNRKLFWSLFKNCKNIYATGFLLSIFKQKINNDDRKLYNDIIKKIDNKYKIENLGNRGEFNFYDLIYFALEYKKFKYMKYEFNKEYLLNNRID